MFHYLQKMYRANEFELLFSWQYEIHDEEMVRVADLKSERIYMWSRLLDMTLVSGGNVTSRMEGKLSGECLVGADVH